MLTFACSTIHFHLVYGTVHSYGTVLMNSVRSLDLENATSNVRKYIRIPVCVLVHPQYQYVCKHTCMPFCVSVCMYVECIFKCPAEQMSAFIPVCIHVPKCEGSLMCVFMLRVCGHACIIYVDTHIYNMWIYIYNICGHECATCVDIRI